MGLARAGVGLVVALWLYGLGPLVGGLQDYWEDPVHLQCGAEAMEFSLPSVLQDAVFALMVIDQNGKPHYLHNDSTCGTWIGQMSDGSLVVGFAFDGCYVREESGNYVVTITLEEILRDGNSQYHKKELACPILLAMDAPSPGECTSVQREERLQCAKDSVSREICEGLGCCFSQYDLILRCYYGKKLTALCTDSNIVVAMSKELTTPSLILDSVRVVDVDSNSCPNLRVTRTDSFIAYQFPLSCGAANQEPNMPVVYENTFVASNLVTTWQKGSITRDSTMKVTVRCSYSHTDVVPLQVEVLTLPPPLPVSTSGPLLLEMRIAEDFLYNSYYADQDYPIERVLRDPVHVEVRILQRTDPSLVLVLNNCWATNSPVPTDDPQWLILTNSCPYSGDNYLTQLVPVGPSSQGISFPTHYKRFIVSTFTFVDSSTQTALNGLVFFHCSASVCVPSAGESCSVNCAQRQKRMVASQVPEDSSTTVTSQGPIIFYSEEDKTDTAVHEEERHLGFEDPLAWLQGAAAAGLILMVSLLGLYLCLRLSRRQKKQAVSTVNA
ncbi:zona pellucida sperm-binding protein 4-like [Eleutherodactylus coqui]|uniref:zona pellucida sperm-binding protein 4-like n=1 Tax=Eleutherodactylus coqui TaxID=57060 RepID=UPI003462B46D